MGRLDRVNELIKEEVGNIISTKVTDPRVGFVTVTNVETSPDLKHAKVFFTILGKQEEEERTLAGLEKAKGFIRKELSRSVRMKYSPDLQFMIDMSLKKANKIGKILHRIEAKEARKEHESE